MPFGCCLHFGNFLCSCRLFLHRGNFLGGVSGLRNSIRCCSASLCCSDVAAVGMPAGSGWMYVGDVRLASCHMPFVGHSINFVVVLWGVPFLVPQVCLLVHLLSPPLVWTSWHTAQCSLPRITRRLLSHYMHLPFHILLSPWLFLHLRQAYFRTWL